MLCRWLITHPILQQVEWKATLPGELFGCDLAALWMGQSVCPSVCPSFTPFSLCSYHRIIMQFSGVIANGRSNVHANGQGQRSKVKFTEAKTQFSHSRTVTPVLIHTWQWNIAQSLAWLRRGAPFVFQGQTATKASFLTQIVRSQIVPPVWIHQWLRNVAQSLT